MTAKKFRIAMILDNPFGPDLRVLREARSLVEAGNEVTIFAWDRDKSITRPGQETIDGIHVIRIEEKSDRQMGIRQIPHHISFSRRVYRLVSQGNFDVVHCHDFPNLPVGVLLKFFKRVYLVYDAHEIYWLMEYWKYPRPVLSFLKWNEIFMMRSADAFITVGEQRADHYQAHYSKKIHVVGNWYDPVLRSEEARRLMRQSLGIHEEDFVLTYAGTLSSVRGTGFLIDFARQIQDLHLNIHLVVAGTGPQQQAFEDCAATLSNLHFLGWLKNTADLYSASDALIYLMDLSHPYSQFNAPNNLYLSIAWAVPLIGVKTGEIAEILNPVVPELLLEKLDTGVLVRVVSELAGDRDLQNSIRARLVDLQTRYCWEAAKGYLISAYENLA